MSIPEALPYLGDQYTVLKKIGAGGMGRVYLAHDNRLDRKVAIKVLNPESAQGVGTQRFVREIRIAAALSHPNIVPLYDSGEFEGHLFYVMPHIEGESLRHRLNREIMLPVGQVLEWSKEVARALAFAHSHGILHRDIKPENLLIQSDRVLVADFGIGRAIDLAVDESLTSEQFIIGTPTYMSPEQATGGKLDGRTDLYSLACVVYEMLAGEPPFRGATTQSLTAKKLSGTYPAVRVVRPTVPKVVAQALDRALAPIPADRFANAEEFAIALAQRPSKAIGRRRVWVPVLALGLAVVALAIGLKARSETRTVARQRVVVGPFENRTGNSGEDPLGLMAADWITEGLQRTGAVDVVPTLSAVAAAQYVRTRSDTTDPIRALAQETGAGLVVSGSIYRDRDSLILQAQLADPKAGKLLGAIEPLRIDTTQYSDALQQLRTRLMGLLALRLDERVIQTERPPTYGAYQAFSEGITAYVRHDYPSAVSAFRRAYVVDSTFVLPLLYASFCHTNQRQYAAADSVLHIVARQRERLTEYHRDWLDYQVAELAGDEMGALSAIRRAAQLAPASKASYNFAVTAYEAGQPFPAESALRLLPPDTGPMRGWSPYWDLLSILLHIQGKRGPELSAAREARRRFPDQVAGYLPEARALAGQRRSTELEQLWTTMQQQTHAPYEEVAELALVLGDELTAHGDSVAAEVWYRRAYATFRSASSSSKEQEDPRWGRARAAFRLGRLREALDLGEALAASDSSKLDYSGFLGVIAARLGDRGRADALGRRLANDQRPYALGHPQFEAARIEAALGDLDGADNLLALAFSRGYPYDIEFHTDPVLRLLPGHSLIRH